MAQNRQQRALVDVRQALEKPLQTVVEETVTCFS